MPLSDTTHDSELLDAADAATDQLEQDTDRVIITQQFVLTAEQFPDYQSAIRFGQKPIQVVDSIEYLDEEGANQTFGSAGTEWDLDQGRREVYLLGENTWPGFTRAQKSIRVTYKAGYGDTHESVPRMIQRAILLQIGFWWDDPTLIKPSDQSAYERIVARLVPTSYLEDAV